jgi:hypothetical protein
MKSQNQDLKDKLQEKKKKLNDILDFKLKIEKNVLIMQKKQMVLKI